jgi:hypothetical protein
MLTYFIQNSDTTFTKYQSMINTTLTYSRINLQYNDRLSNTEERFFE